MCRLDKPVLAYLTQSELIAIVAREQPFASASTCRLVDAVVAGATKLVFGCNYSNCFRESDAIGKRLCPPVQKVNDNLATLGPNRQF